jgi:hypothetical protein
MSPLDLSEFEIPPEHVERPRSRNQEPVKHKAQAPEWHYKLAIRHLLELSTQDRIWLYVRFRTRDGQRPMLFTTEDAEMLGVKHNKIRELRRLEAKGKIKLTTHGTATATVTLAPEDDEATAELESQIDYWLGRPKRGFRPQ